MRHVITFALFAALLVFSIVQAHPGVMNKECWENRPTVKPTDCCQGLTMLPEAALEECTKLYPDEDEDNDNQTNEDDDEDDDDDDKHKHHHHRHHHHHHRHHCVVECYFNKTGLYKDRHVVKAIALKLFSENTESTGTFQAVLSSGIDSCIAEQDTMENKFKEMIANGDHPRPRPHHHDDGKHCPPKATFFSKCVEMNAFKNCPAERKVSSAECTKLTQFIEKCAPKFPKE